MFLKIILLAGLIKLMVEYDQPYLCAGLYAGCVFFLGLAFGNPLAPVAIATTIVLAIATVYFWLLSKAEGSPLWWIIMIAGLPIALL